MQAVDVFHNLVSVKKTQDFSCARHPGESRDPEDSTPYWIPAFAGMTIGVVSGWEPGGASKAV
jgi:hypothetical protein